MYLSSFCQDKVHGIFTQRVFPMQVFAVQRVQQAGAVHRFGNRGSCQFNSVGITSRSSAKSVRTVPCFPM